MQQFTNLESAIFAGFSESERNLMRQYLNRALRNMNTQTLNFFSGFS